jgi:hypothetical protein
VQHKKVNPFRDYLIGFDGDKLLKKSHLIGFKWSASRHTGVTNFLDHTVDQDDFGPRLAPLSFTVNVDRFMLVGVEHHVQAEILV